jgi:hypothetical protein
MSWRVPACRRFYLCFATPLLALVAGPLGADSYYTVTPCRVFDTRSNNSPIPTNVATSFGIGGTCGVPLEATAVSCNTTLLPQGISIDLGEFPGDLVAPTNTNVVSAGPNQAIAGFSVMPLSNDGQGSIALLPNSAANGLTDVVFDVSGYFLPDTFQVLWPGAPDDDPGLSDNTAVTYSSTLGQGSASGSAPAGPLTAGQGGAGSHYFVSSGQPVPLVGVSADNACHFRKPGAGQCNVGNYEQVITDAANNGLNVIRLLVNVGLPASGCVYDATNSDPNDQPFEYDNSNQQGNNLGRWHLDVQNTDYFSRLQQVVQYASTKNMFVEVTVFAPQQAQLYLSPWSPNHAYLKNGSKLSGFTSTTSFVDASSTNAEYQSMKQYVFNVVDWTVDSLHSFSNVYYEVANEPDWIIDALPPPCPSWNTKSLTDPTIVSAWQDAIVGRLKADMATKGVTQQIAVEALRFADANRFTGSGQYTSDASIINSHYTRLNPPFDTHITDGLGAIRLARGYYSQPKILGFNETKIVKGGCAVKPGAVEGVQEGRAEAWEFMVHQGGVYNQFGYDCATAACPLPNTLPMNTSAGPDYCETRREMGTLRSFLAGPVRIGTNMVTTKDGDGTSTPGPDWINMLPYPLEPFTPGAINKFWAAVEPTATAAAKRWLLYIHQSVDRGAQFDAYRMPPHQPLYHERSLSVCLGPASGTYYAHWIAPAFPLTPSGAVNPVATQQINWTGSTSCVPGNLSSGAQPLNPSPGYHYDIALFISISP